MAGLALYGDLAPALASAGPVILRHRLESVKILPPVGANDPDLYGAVTALATTLPEIQAPFRRRVFSMAVTAPPDGQQGQPTSWSAAVDALAAGRSFDAATEGLVYLDQAERNAHRLFVLAAGNIDEAKLNPDYLSICDTEAVHDPRPRLERAHRRGVHREGHDCGRQLQRLGTCCNFRRSVAVELDGRDAVGKVAEQA